MQFMSAFSSLSRAGLKDCIADENQIIFIVSPGDLSQAIGPKAINVHKLEKLAVPNLTVKELDQLATAVSKKDFSVMSKDATIADVVKKFKETKCEIIILQDKNNKVIGTINPLDLLHLLDRNGGPHA